MFPRIKKLIQLLSGEQRKTLLRLQLLVVLVAFAEVAGVFAIGPFMGLVGDMGRLEGNGLIAKIYLASNIDSHQQFLFWLGIAVLVVLASAAALSMYTIWRLSLYGSQIGAELSTRLYKHYMYQEWLFHASGSSSQLTNRIAQESNRITTQVIQPLMLMNAKATLGLVLSIAIFAFNPGVAVSALAIFGAVYFVLYKTVRQRLIRNGQTVSESNQMRFKLMNEGFGGIKDTLLLGRQADFNQRFENASREFGLAQGVTKGLSQVPRYLMEFVAFSAAIALMLYLLEVYEGDLGSVLPILSVYLMAGLKLLPAFQQVYSSLAQVKGNLAAFDCLENDLKESQQSIKSDKHPANAGKFRAKELIKLENIFLTYPNKEEKALCGLSIEIPVNRVVGLVGASGSGKSTAIDVLLGLIEPQQGHLKVDRQVLEGKQLRVWQNNVGFVPQSIFLADATIKENVAFGLPPEEIDIERVSRAIQMAHLDELLDRLPDGLDTRVGERGVQLSGGQRQRIGIARALYDDAEVLVLDEATSALDGITEKLVMDAIHDFSGKKTIIMIAHRLSTVKQCDIVFVIDKGKVIDQGTYQQLIENNPDFKRMAEHS